MASTPGTVSKILWHFTGGPLWDSKKNRQRTKPKSAAQAYSALLSILRMKELRLGNYKEVVKVRIPRRKVYDPNTMEFNVERNVMVELTSAPVNCLADIPIMHLSYHAQRYGKFAIGFHREAAMRHGFSPLMYSLHDATFLRSINRGFAALDSVDLDAFTDEASHIMHEMQNARCEYGHLAESDAWGSAQNIETYAEDVSGSIDDARSSFSRLLAFVKTFDREKSTASIANENGGQCRLLSSRMTILQ